MIARSWVCVSYRVAEIRCYFLVRFEIYPRSKVARCVFTDIVIRDDAHMDCDQGWARLANLKQLAVVLNGSIVSAQCCRLVITILIWGCMDIMNEVETALRKCHFSIQDSSRIRIWSC